MSLKSFLRAPGRRMASLLLFAFLVALGIGLYRLFTLSLPVSEGKWEKASQSRAADVPSALFNAGLTAYKDGDYQRAKDLLTKAFSACTDADGRMGESQKKQAAKIQFHLGLCAEQLHKDREAVEAYKSSLKLDDSNLECKNNLERLQNSSGTRGGGDGQNPQTQPPNGKNQNDNRKRI